jgi:cytoskeletal protein RodZ
VVEPLPEQGAPEPEPIGRALTQAREAAGLSVEQVSERTRIRATLIRQMELDDFTGVGGSVYARGHLRSIARTLDLDPAPLVAAYDAGHESVPSPVVAPPSGFDPLRHGEPRGRRGSRRWGTAMVASTAALCLLVLFVVLGRGSSSDDTSRVTGQAPGPTPAASAPAPTQPPPTQPPPTQAPPTQPTTPPSGVSLRLEARDAQSWLEVRDETQHVVFQQLLRRGDTRTLTAAQSLQVRMGNAGAMDLSCNGRDLGRLGAPGQVVTVQVALGTAGACTVDGGTPGAGATAGAGALPDPAAGPATAGAVRQPA